jgi:thymidylate kinase
MKKGKLIVLYGINNLGKTTQAKLLVKKIKQTKRKAEYVKYPIYNIEPAGRLINDYLRKNNPYKFTPREIQLLHYIDRISFEPALINKLNKGINIIAEDYFGTALAWGISAGVDKKLLLYLNKFIYKENIAFLLDGNRFKEATEKNHKHETDKKLINKARQIHLKLAKKFNWIKIEANLAINQVHENIWQKIKNKI